MIDYDLQLKLQAHLDGELSPAEARGIQARLARDPEARALLAELTATTAALADFEDGRRLPESREFFWSKIEREIHRDASSASPSAALPWWAGWRRWLVPIGTAAMVALAGLMATRPGLAPEAEAELADPGAFTYRDYTARTTLVWLSYPAEKEFPADDGSDTMD